MSNWTLYMIRDGHGCLYTGISTDVHRRLNEHASGAGARALRGKGPLELVFHVPVGGHSQALRLEYLLKRWPKWRKEALLRGECDPPELH